LVPWKYCEKLIVEELINNFLNHGDSSKKLELTINHEQPDIVIITICNAISKQKNDNSNLEGTRCLNSLKETDYFGFDYDFDQKGDKFYQVYQFKKLANEF
jgi:hypothetical protein